jgi:anti-anti-sigma regulatory factor
MLRISIDEAQEVVTLRLEGRLIGAWVGEVERCWRKATAGLDERAVVIDLTAVSFVDSDGGALLAKMQEAGFRLMGAGSWGSPPS